MIADIIVFCLIVGSVCLGIGILVWMWGLWDYRYPKKTYDNFTSELMEFREVKINKKDECK